MKQKYEPNLVVMDIVQTEVLEGVTLKWSRYQSQRDIPNWVKKVVSPVYKWVWNRSTVGATGYRVCPIRWSYSGRFDKFEWGNLRYFSGSPYIRLVKRSEFWSTYDMKTVGLTANSIECKNKYHRMELQMVHEFTHWFDYLEDSDYSGSEVRTTQAEIDFVKQFRPYLYDQLEQI